MIDPPIQTTTFKKKLRRFFKDHGLNYDKIMLEYDDNDWRFAFRQSLRATVKSEVDWWGGYWDATGDHACMDDCWAMTGAMEPFPGQEE